MTAIAVLFILLGAGAVPCGIFVWLVRLVGKKSHAARWLWITLVGFVTFAIGIAFMPVAEPQSNAPRPEPEPTTTSGPTYTPRPTNTPRPTETPRPTRTPTPDVGDKYMADVMCEDFVLQNLKAPSTAEFGPFRERIIVETSPQIWTVQGYVDSQNSFGAMIRTRYTCRVGYRGNDLWVLLGLDFF